MLRKSLNKNSFFYKPYLLYNLFVQNRCYIKRETYSQFQEDIFINNYFKEFNKGTYVDIGCFHPIMHSNTAKLYNKGWKGINIDLNPISIDLFNILRKRDKNYCAAISNSNKKVKSYIDDYFSPINSINKKFFNYTFNEFSKGDFIEQEIDSYKLQDFFLKEGLKIDKIDFLNVDVEANDLKVLEGIDFNNLNIKLICVEMFNEDGNIDQNTFTDLLKVYNYKLIKVIGPNGFFEKDK